MKKRFSARKYPKLYVLHKYRISILLFTFFFIFLYCSVHQIQISNAEKQYRSLETALRRDIIHCYSVEGTYPPSLQYMKDHYGLIYNENDFYIDYKPIGSNIFPEFEIIQIHKK